MSHHAVGSRQEWLAARFELPDAEKAHTRAADELGRRRRELPWVRIEKDYRFQTADGEASLRDLFGGRSQLLVYHFMFPSCPSCGSMAYGFDGFVVHLEHHDVAFVAVCRTPIDELESFKARMGWRFRFASSAAATSTTTSAFRSATISSLRGRSTTSGACGCRGIPRTRRTTFLGRARSRSRTTRCTTPTRATVAAATCFGACTSGSTEHRSGATRSPSTGVGSATSTTSDTDLRSTLFTASEKRISGRHRARRGGLGVWSHRPTTRGSQRRTGVASVSRPRDGRVTADVSDRLSCGHSAQCGEARESCGGSDAAAPAGDLDSLRHGATPGFA
jgi:peroxiredoxin